MNWDEKQEFLKKLPGYIILVRKPNDPVIYGIVENSWSIAIEPNRAFLYWTAGEMDGHKWANKELISFSIKNPDWVFTMYDARDEEKLPVVLNWDLWLDGHQPSDKTISGVKNKHEARNLRFTLKGEPVSVVKVARSLKTGVSSIQFNTPVNLETAIEIVKHLERKH